MEVAEGWLFVGSDIDAAVDSGRDATPLLFGRLLQPVLADELSWAVDEDASGEPVLCIELPKKTSGAGVGAVADCIFDETLHIDGSPVLQPGLSQGMMTVTLPKGAADMLGGHGGAARGGAPSMMADDGVDVSDLGLTMDDLDAPLPEELFGGSGGLETSGSQSTSGVPGNTDLGCEWTETPGTLAATLKIPGLRGQPAMALNIDLTDSTFVVTVFGMQVWSSVLKGLIDPSASTWSVEEGSDMTPLVQVELKKATAGRWGGLIDSIGVDSVLQ